MIVKIPAIVIWWGFFLGRRNNIVHVTDQAMRLRLSFVQSKGKSFKRRKNHKI